MTESGRSDGIQRWALVGNLAAQVGIVVTGGLVRLTGSGLGCPTWPQCVPGSYTPVPHPPEGYHQRIEFYNRTLIFLVSVAALAALVVVVQAVRAGRLRPGLLALGALPLVGVFAQALLGGLTVLTGLSPWIVAAHFLLSMLLVAGSTLLLLWAAPGAGPEVPPVRRELVLLGRAIVLVGAAVLVLGTLVTGSGPHSGDPKTPRFGFDPRAVSWLHADAVWLFVGLVVALVVGLRVLGAPRPVRRRAGWLLAVTLLQGLIGYIQYATGLPIPVVTAHLLGASLLVVAIVAAAEPIRAFSAATGRVPAEQPRAPAITG